jgi:protein SCO1/2
MNLKAMTKHRTLLIAALTLSLAACNSGPVQPPLDQAPLAGAAIGGDFTLTSQSGSKVSWGDFAGRHRIVYFGFAYCPDICPTDLSRTAQGLRLYAEKHPELAATIQPIFITIDPERDTPEVVGEFVGNFSDDLIGLTGTPEEIKQAADAFKVFYARGEDTEDGAYLMDHSNITYLFGPEGQPLATLPTDLGPEAIAAELEKWVR